MSEPLWIDQRDVLVIHDRLIALEAGSTGIRSVALLQSALARPQQLYAYGKSPDTMDMAAAYAAGIVRNHPFVDGNKRTGFVVAVLLLEVNGYRFTAREEDATQAVLGLAAGTLDEAAFTDWLRNNVRVEPT